MTLSLQPARFEAGDGRAVDAEIGRLTVPMDRTMPGRGSACLAFVRLPSVSKKPGAPVVFLNGGPGLSGIRAGKGRLFGLFDALRAAGDVILLDQRGSGASTPSLECEVRPALAVDRAFSREDALRAAIDSTRRCAEQLARDGVDLGAFNTNESADDVADLVRALGADRAALLGWSYGTHLAFAVMRRHETLVERAVLAGPEGPDHTYKLPSRIQRQLETIAARARKDGAAPDLLAAMATPRAAMGRFELEWITSEGMGDTRMLARLPLWYTRGDLAAVMGEPGIRDRLRALRTGSITSLLRVCMDCASGASPERWRRIESEARATLLGRTIDFPFPEICDAVGRPELGDDFRAPLHSNVPVLFITGTLDARTPAENVADLAPGFPHHRHLVVEDAGHTDLLFPSGVQRAVARFLTQGEIETDRVEADEPFRFVRSEPVLLYDGDCGFCRRQVERLRVRVGGAVHFEPYQSAGHVAGVSPSDLARAVHFVDAEGRVSSGAEAIYATLAAGGHRTRLLWMYRRLPGFAPLSELGYRLIARHRVLVGRIISRG